MISRLFVFLIIVGFASTPSYAAVNSPLSGPQGERKVEQDRENALMQAIASVDPKVKEQAIEISKAPLTNEQVGQEVQRLRTKRRAQFKYLTWSHIKQMINEDTVRARLQFLEQRDKNLAKVIERSLDVHVPAKMALERITLAKFKITKAIRDFFPEARFETDLKHGPLSDADYISKRWRVLLRQPLFRGGVLYNTLMLEISNLEVAKREYDKTLSDLIAEVSEAYFEYERAQNVFKQKQKLFEEMQKQKKISDQKYDAQLSSEIEKLNVDSLYSQSQYDMETATQEIEVSKLDLQKFLNLEMNDPIDVEVFYDLTAAKVTDLKGSVKLKDPKQQFSTDLNKFVELAYVNRPDLQVEASKLKAANYAYRVAIGRRLPQADLIFECGELAESFVEQTKHPFFNNEYRFGVEFTWPLEGNTIKYTFDNDQRAPSVSQFQQQQFTKIRSNSISVGILDDLGQFASLKQAQIDSLTQIVELEKTERDVIRQVKEAYFNFNKSIIQVESAYKRMDYRERLSQVSLHRLGNNEIQISEYLQAVMSSVEERGLVYKALADFFLSKAKLNRAIGLRDYIVVDSL